MEPRDLVSSDGCQLLQAVVTGPSATNLIFLLRLVILVSRVSAILRTVPGQWHIENFPCPFRPTTAIVGGLPDRTQDERGVRVLLQPNLSWVARSF